MKTIMRFIKPYKWLCAITLLTMVLDVAGGLLIPTITADMINVGVGGGDLQYLIRSGMMMLGVTLVTSFGALAGSYFCSDLSAKIGRDMRNALYDKSLTFSAHDFEQYGTGSMITRTLNDVSIVQQSIVWCIQMVLPVPVVCIMGIVMAFSIDRTMGFLLIGVTVLIVVLAVFVTRKASVIFEKLQSFLDRMNVVLRENITGVRVIRAFNKEHSEEARLKKTFEDYAESSIKANRLFVALESTALLAINLSIVAILWAGGNRIGAGYMEIGDITALSQYAIMILYYIIMAQMVFIMLPRAVICTRRIKEVLTHKPEIADGGQTGPDSRCSGQDTSVSQPADPVRPNTDPLAEAGHPTTSLAGRPAVSPTGHQAATPAGYQAVWTAGCQTMKPTDVIRFRDAAFRFADADEDTLGDISFTCKRGQTTAIIGSTGSGKSTIAKLILRFHDVTGGSIELNGCDIRQLSQQELRDRIAYVPQKAWLFSGTIADNLRNGKADATEEEMNHALSIAQADFVETLRGGLQARVSQGGTNFSGGQKQRLSIARALMKHADLYIFDDSFSALDFKTDAALRNALAAETKDAAVLIIAQRISTILNAEQIIVLEDGRIVGMGSHQSLMQTCPVYQEIAQSQMKGEETDE